MDVSYLIVYSRVIRPKINHNRLLKKKSPSPGRALANQLVFLVLTVIGDPDSDFSPVTGFYQNSFPVAGDPASAPGVVSVFPDPFINRINPVFFNFPVSVLVLVRSAITFTQPMENDSAQNCPTYEQADIRYSTSAEMPSWGGSMPSKMPWSSLPDNMPGASLDSIARPLPPSIPGKGWCCCKGKKQDRGQ
jgi:hypothetical protein